jgi:hypothetical protein
MLMTVGHTRASNCSRSLLHSMESSSLESSHHVSPCEGCGYAQVKQKAVSKTTNRKADKPGKRIVLDAAGPYHETLGGNKYWFEAVDDWSRHGWDHFDTRKGKMVEFARALFINLKAQDKAVEYLCCNNAGENVKALKGLCNEFNVIVEFTAPDTPQQNGVVERRIAVLTQRANAMMMAANLSEDGRKLLWVEAVHTAKALENITSTTVNKKSAYELMTGKQCKLIPYLQPFGRLGTVTIRRKFSSKWKEKGKKMVMTGYGANHTGDTYKTFDPVA